MAKESVRTTGNDPVEGADPGGSRSTHPGQEDKTNSGKQERTTEQPVVSGDRNTSRPEELARDRC